MWGKKEIILPGSLKSVQTDRMLSNVKIMHKICKTREQNNIVKVTVTNPCNTEAVPQSPCASNAVPQIILCYKCILINSNEFNSFSF